MLTKEGNIANQNRDLKLCDLRFEVSRVWQSYQSILHITVAKKSVNALTLAPGLTKSQLWQ